MRDYARYNEGRDEEQWVEDVLALTVPSTRQDLRTIVFLLARGNISAINLGRKNYKNERGRSVENTERILRKLDELRAGIQNSPLRDLPESDRLFRMVDTYGQAFSGFLQGKTWATVPRDTGLLSATLDSSDVRSASLGVGLKGGILQHIRTTEERRIIDEYRDHLLLGPATVNFLAHKVPVATLQYFLDSFTQEQVYECWETITSPAVAVSLAADPSNTEYIDFVVSVVAGRLNRFGSGILEESVYKTAYPYLDWSKPQHTLRLLFDVVPGTTKDEKIAFLENNVKGRSLMLEDVAILIKRPEFSDGSFYKLCDEYQRTFVPDEILSMLECGYDIKKAKERYDSLPECMQSVKVVMALQAQLDARPDGERKLQELISYLNPEIENGAFPKTIFHWFFDTYDKAKADIALLKNSGVRSLYYMYELSNDSRITVAYAALVHTVVPEDFRMNSSMRTSIFEWYWGGVTVEELRECGGLWDESKRVHWYEVNVETLKTYVALKKDPAKFELLTYVCDTYDEVPARIVPLIDEGCTKEMFDAVKSRRLPSAWVRVLKKSPDMIAQFDALSEEKKYSIRVVDTGKLLSMLGQTDLVIEDFTAKQVEQGKTDLYANFLDKRSSRHEDYVKYFSFFGVSPEYMSEKLALTAYKNELDDTMVNHIILCAYLENTLLPKHLPLIEQNNISTFTRYPVEVLRSMSEGYSSESDRKKTKVAVTLFAGTDWNNALDKKSEIVQAIYQDHQVYIYEVATKMEFFRAIRRLGEQLSEKISLLCFDAHGSDDMLQLGFPYSPRRTELTKATVKFFGPLRRFFTPDAQLVLASCSAAEGGAEADNLAVAFARVWPGVEVFAPNQDTGTSGIRFTHEGRVSAVEYTAPNAMEVIKF